jgi:leucyl/phenylalanyl-tRNA--protein transferase
MPLSPELILDAYRRGIFPMADPKSGRIEWFEPHIRGIIPLDAFHVPHTTRRFMKKFEITSDRAFEDVIDGCADRRETWISKEIREAYVAIFRKGHAHSIETWWKGGLAGGVYGVHIGGAFMAESMFHRRTEGSKVALVALLERLKARGFALCDIQMVTPHTAQFGAVEITGWQYRDELRKAVALDVRW